MASPGPASVSINAPATIGNVGPGFDVMSLALTGLGDTLELAPADQDELVVEGPGAESVPAAWSANLATRTLDRLRARTSLDQPLRLVLHKPRAAGSGLGSSASSAAGAALAFHALHPEARLSPEALVRAAGRAEGGAQGHYDDVAAVVLGGLALVRPPVTADGEVGLQRVAPPDGLHIALAVPAMELPTERMRALLPDHVPLSDAVANLTRVASLVDAFHRGDVAAIGASLEDRLATPHRAKALPFFHDAAAAGRQAGAEGVAISGSGPTLFAVCQAPGDAQAVAQAMARVVERHGHPCQALTARPEHEVPYDAVEMR